jgi:hypothetical protein
MALLDSSIIAPSSDDVSSDEGACVEEHAASASETHARARSFFIGKMS